MFWDGDATRLRRGRALLCAAFLLGAGAALVAPGAALAQSTPTIDIGRVAPGVRATQACSSFHRQASACSSGTSKQAVETTSGPSTGPNPASSIPAILANEGSS